MDFPPNDEADLSARSMFQGSLTPIENRVNSGLPAHKPLECALSFPRGLRRFCADHLRARTRFEIMTKAC